MEAALIVLDGWALGPGDPRAPASVREAAVGDRRNAVVAADTPTFDRIADEGAFGALCADGRCVGLPDGQMGNSEVGHLTIGAGRRIAQAYTQITDAVADGSIRENEALQDAFEYAREHDGIVHFIGLVSDGGVHADDAHLRALIAWAGDEDVEAVTHAITDGRDTSPTGGVEYLATLEAAVARAGTGDVATVTGRYYAMDRDANWERTKRAYDAIVEREADHVAPTPVAAVEASYERDVTDEFVEPTLIRGTPSLADGDAVIWTNFRADRARQLTRMLADIGPEDWTAVGETAPPDSLVTTMTQYDRTFDLPVAISPNQPRNTLGAVLEAAGLTQLRIAESEKYAHVTYFLNGGREVEFDGEIREIVPSPDVPTYDLQPAMSAPEVTDTAIDRIATDDPDVLVLNYANPDMVGHTGDFDAAVRAVEAVDTQLGRLLDVLDERGAHVLVTADHGNADDMGTVEDPHTAHTTNPVPVVYLGPGQEFGPGQVFSPGKEFGPGLESGSLAMRDGGELADLAPTLLSCIAVSPPEEMTGRSLLEDDSGAFSRQ